MIFLSPALSGPPDRISRQPTIELIIEDKRGTKIIGSRGGTIDELATLKTQEDIRPSLTNKLRAELEEQGYLVLDAGGGAEAKLVVALEDLTYETGGSVLTEIKVGSQVGVTCSKGDRTLTSRYKTNHREEFATAPSEAKNSELINMVVGKSLDQLLADDELREFMTN